MALAPRLRITFTPTNLSTKKLLTTLVSAVWNYLTLLSPKYVLHVSKESTCRGLSWFVSFSSMLWTGELSCPQQLWWETRFIFRSHNSIPKKFFVFILKIWGKQTPKSPLNCQKSQKITITYLWFLWWWNNSPEAQRKLSCLCLNLLVNLDYCAPLHPMTSEIQNEWGLVTYNNV